MKQIIAKETEKQYYIESNDITKITKKHYKSKQEKNIGNYMKMKKNTKGEYGRNRYYNIS